MKRLALCRKWIARALLSAFALCPALAQVDGVPRSVGASQAVDEVQKPGAPLSVLAGRVLDDRRRGVAGATVWLVTDQGHRASTVSLADGSYRLEGIPFGARGRYEIGLRARTPDGRGAAVPGRRATKPAEALAGPAGAPPGGALILSPARDIEVLVTDDGEPAVGTSVLLLLSHDRILAGDGKTNEQGLVRFEGVPFGELRVIARAPGKALGGEAYLSGESSRKGARIDVPLDIIDTFSVSVVSAGDGAPVAGAQVFAKRRYGPGMTFMFMDGLRSHLPSMRPVPGLVGETDAKGQIVFPCRPGVRLQIHASHRDADANVRFGSMGDDVELSLLIDPPPRVVRFAIAAEQESLLPTPGGALQLRTQPGAGFFGGTQDLGTAAMDGEDLVVTGAPLDHYNAVVLTEKGSYARLYAEPGQKRGRPASFQSTATVTVSITNEMGEPVPGARIGARNQGNNEVGEPALADAGGVAVLRDLHGGLLDIEAFPPDELGSGRTQVGSIKVSAGDVALGCVLPDCVEATFQVTIDGEPRLPSLFATRGVRVVDEDASKATLRLRGYLKPRARSLKFNVLLGPEYQRFSADIDLEALRGSEPVPLGLKRAGILAAKVGGLAKVGSVLMVDRQSESGEWIAIRRSDLEHPNGDDGRYEFGRLESGTYRVRERDTGRTGHVVWVDAAHGWTTTRVEFGENLILRGSVTAPEDADLSLARVIVSGLKAAPNARRPFDPLFPPGSIEVAADGSFELPMQKGASPTLTVWHPLLAAATEGGSITATDAEEGVTLTLVRGAIASFSAEGVSRGGRMQADSRVLLLKPSVGAGANADEVAAAVLSEHPLVFDGDSARFGGFAPGRYSVWIDPGGNAPVVVPAVDFGVGVTDLTTPTFGDGASIRFVLLLEDGASAPRIFPVVTPVARGPRKSRLYSRSLNSRGESEVILKGLGPGDFWIEVRRIGERGFLLEQGVVIEAGKETVIEIDLMGQ